MRIKKFLKAVFIRNENGEEQKKEYKTYSIAEYEKMDTSKLLELRYDKTFPIEELDKVLEVLERKFPLGVCRCRNWA